MKPLTAPYVSHRLNCSAFCDSQKSSLIFLLPHFSSPVCQSISSYNKCVCAAWLQRSELQTWATGHRQKTRKHPDRDPLLYYYCASATIVMTLPAGSLISLFKSVHSSMLACVKRPATTARLYTSFPPPTWWLYSCQTRLRRGNLRTRWKRDLWSGLREEIIYPQELLCCLWQWNKAENQDQILFYVRTLDDNIDIEDGFVDNKYSNVLHTCTEDFFYASPLNYIIWFASQTF